MYANLNDLRWRVVITTPQGKRVSVLTRATEDDCAAELITVRRTISALHPRTAIQYVVRVVFE